MTESRIFQILLKNNGNVNFTYDYPNLQAEAVDVVAEKFTEILYETNRKSTTSQVLRGNILKYLHTTCRVRQSHLDEDSYECFLKILRRSLRCNFTGDISKLGSEIASELETNVPLNLSDKIIDFYKRKNCKRKEKLKKLEYIGKMSQERLDLKLDMQVGRKFSYYEISENVIKDLVGPSNTKSVENVSLINKMETGEYREKQIKFCFALLNLKGSDLYLLEIILQRLADYKGLKAFEINFLLYLWNFEDESLDYSSIVSEKFPLVLERIIVKHCTEILQLKEDIEVHQYFLNLEKHKTLLKIKKSCSKSILINTRMKSLIYELYCYSYCNKNILRLIKFIQ